jgi:hypothetical protein
MFDAGVDDDLIRIALEHAFIDHGQYRVTVVAGDDEQIEQLARLGALVADEHGWTMSRAALRQPDGIHQLCLLTVDDSPARG